MVVIAADAGEAALVAKAFARRQLLATREHRPPAPGPIAYPATAALWLEDTHAYACEADVLGVETSDSGGTTLVLSATVFHPQGGGQPADIGLIRSARDEGAHSFEVTSVRQRAGGVVVHEGAAPAPFRAGDRVICEIDSELRRLHARLHSAGHLIDVAMRACGCTLAPTKGCHFPSGAYVEYAGKLTADEREALAPRLQEAIGRLVSEAAPTVVRTVPARRLHELCPPETVPANFLGVESAVRVVTVSGLATPCGGTHVRHAGEIAPLRVHGVKTKNGATRVSYSCSAS